MKLIPINMVYCLFHFDVLNLFLEIRQDGASLPKFNFFSMQTLKFDNEILKFATQIPWIQIFTLLILV